jgi:hypothetical protein
LSYSVSADVKALLGVEWFASENISFLAEYACYAGYRYASSESESDRRYPDRETKSESTQNMFRFSSNEVKFGLSVYF